MKRRCQRLIAAAMMLLPVLLIGAALAGEPPQSSGPRRRGTPGKSEPQLQIKVGGTATLEFIETPLQEVIDCINHLHELKNRPPQSPAILVRGAQSSWETKIEQALSDSTTLHFIETPLQDVINYLKDLHSIEIQLDEPALHDGGIGSDTPITRDLKGISLRSALRLMLRELEVTYVMRDEVLLITTPATIREKPVTRVYCVAQLLDFGETAHQLAEKLPLVFPTVEDATTQMRIVPHRQALIVQGNLEQHESLEWLLDCLRRACRTPVRGKAGNCAANCAGADRFDRTVRSPANTKIEAALRDHTHLEFIETPLQDVVDYLKDMHSIEIQIAARALEDVGIGSDSPITISLKGVSLRSALRLMLRQHDLTFVIRDEVLLITPVDFPGAAATRVYCVAELLGFGESSDELAETLTVATARQDNPSVAVKEGEAKQKKSPPELRIVPYRQAIVVLASADEHEALGRLLHELSLGLQGKARLPVRPEKASAAGTAPSPQRSGKPRSERRDKSVGKSGDNEESRKRGGDKDPFAGPATDPAKSEPFGAGTTRKEDPFGGSAKDEDPFGGGAPDEDPFGDGKKQEDPFGGTDGENPFG